VKIQFARQTLAELRKCEIKCSEISTSVNHEIRMQRNYNILQYICPSDLGESPDMHCHEIFKLYGHRGGILLNPRSNTISHHFTYRDYFKTVSKCLSINLEMLLFKHLVN